MGFSMKSTIQLLGYPHFCNCQYMNLWPHTRWCPSQTFVGFCHPHEVVRYNPHSSTLDIGGSSHLVSGLVHPSYKWTLPPLIPFITRVSSPTYDPWDEPPSRYWSSPSGRDLELGHHKIPRPQQLGHSSPFQSQRRKNRGKLVCPSNSLFCPSQQSFKRQTPLYSDWDMNLANLVPSFFEVNISWCSPTTANCRRSLKLGFERPLRSESPLISGSPNSSNRTRMPGSKSLCSEYPNFEESGHFGKTSGNSFDIFGASFDHQYLDVLTRWRIATSCEIKDIRYIKVPGWTDSVP